MRLILLITARRNLDLDAIDLNRLTSPTRGWQQEGIICAFGMNPHGSLSRWNRRVDTVDERITEA